MYSRFPQKRELFFSPSSSLFVRPWRKLGAPNSTNRFPYTHTQNRAGLTWLRWEKPGGGEQPFSSLELWEGEEGGREAGKVGVAVHCGPHTDLCTRRRGCWELPERWSRTCERRLRARVEGGSDQQAPLSPASAPRETPPGPGCRRREQRRGSSFR